MEGLKGQGNSEEMSKAITNLEKLKKKTDECDKKVTVYFENQDKLSEKIGESMTEIEIMIERMEDLNTQKEAVTAWSKEEKGISVVKATGLIVAETEIHGKHSVIKIKEDARNVTVKEVNLPDTESAYEMTIVRN